ncbi:MAG: exosortase/archaeosortase family protein [Phycisphaerales bacterium]|nr:exosortase/archaeosortase family protein [Phycisphaerales bacterium]
MMSKSDPPARTTHGTAAPWGPLIVLLAAFTWCYGATLRGLVAEWRASDEYSVGALVPLVAAYVLWSQRKQFFAPLWGVAWSGLLVFGFSQALWFLGVYRDHISLTRYSLIFALAGIVLVVFGWRVMRRLVWVTLFLFLMVPLPGRVHDAVSLPLQDIATRSAVFNLELLGFWVVRTGNIITVNESTQVAVAEACNGLRMLTAFVFVCSAMAFMVGRPAWQRAFIVLSSIPIAVVTNTIRLVVTVILFDLTNSDFAEKFFHDFAGILMMPLAIAVVFGELWLLQRLTLPPAEAATRGVTPRKLTPSRPPALERS